MPGFICRVCRSLVLTEVPLDQDVEAQVEFVTTFTPEAASQGAEGVCEDCAPKVKAWIEANRPDLLL